MQLEAGWNIGLAIETGAGDYRRGLPTQRVGDLASELHVITVTNRGSGPLTVSVESASIQGGHHNGIETDTKDSVVLPGVVVVNTPATGLPTIIGTVRVGETLTAETAAIDDDDGLDNVSYSYQWIPNDGNGDADVAEATSRTYSLADADEGRTIRAKVSFTDDRNF